MADPEICESGVWVDDDGQVVTTQPVQGTQLIAPGSVITPADRASVERAGGSLEPTPEPAEVAEVVETATDEPEVETASVETKTTRRKR